MRLRRRLSLVTSQMSQWEPNSDISRFNRAPAGTWHSMPEEFFRVLQAALDLARDSNGAYDPTLGALTDLWGFGPNGRRHDVPEPVAIEQAKSRSGWQRIALDAGRRAALQAGGVQLDLSSIAKGFAVDLVSETLSRRGLADHLVEIGGELRGSGTKPGLSPWWVAMDSRRLRHAGRPAQSVDRDLRRCAPLYRGSRPQALPYARSAHRLADLPTRSHRLPFSHRPA